MRSPSVERLIPSSDAAFDLLPPAARSADMIRWVSNAAKRLSSDSVVAIGTAPGDAGCGTSSAESCNGGNWIGTTFNLS